MAWAAPRLGHRLVGIKARGDLGRRLGLPGVSAAPRLADDAGVVSGSGGGCRLSEPLRVVWASLEPGGRAPTVSDQGQRNRERQPWQRVRPHRRGAEGAEERLHCRTPLVAFS